MRHAGLLLLVVLLGSLPPLAAEEIYLKNGDRFSGVVRGYSADRVELETPFGSLQLAKAEIQKIIFHRAAEAGELALAPATVEDILEAIRCSRARFYLDGSPLRGERLANSVRLRAMLQAPTLRDPREFVNRFLTRSETGGRFQVRDGGPLVDLPEWLSARMAGGLKLAADSPREETRLEPVRRMRGGKREL